MSLVAALNARIAVLQLQMEDMACKSAVQNDKAAAFAEEAKRKIIVSSERLSKCW